MKDKVEEYIKNIIKLTWDFIPEVDVQETYPGTIQVFIGGNESQRAQLMGREAKTVQALTKLTQIFCSRNKTFVYLYIKPKSSIKDSLDRNLEDATNIGIFL